MNDYLEKTCVNLGIKLLYTNNKITVLSADTKNDLPTIRAHKVFRGCPYEVALAIISYYSTEKNTAENEQLLKNYLQNKLSSCTFKIKPVDTSFRKSIEKSIPFKNTSSNSNTSLIEFTISSMIVKDFQGNELQNASINSLKPSSNDILDLDIIVSLPVT